jgi:hypothetical protein
MPAARREHPGPGHRGRAPQEALPTLICTERNAPSLGGSGRVSSERGRPRSVTVCVSSRPMMSAQAFQAFRLQSKKGGAV